MKRTRSTRGGKAGKNSGGTGGTGGIGSTSGGGNKKASLLEGVILCCTGLTTKVKDSLKAKVEAMGGKVEGSLAMHTTHLVAACVDTEKYKFATSMLDIAVVRPDWVTDTWREGRKLPCRDYALLPFEGLTITITGLPFERKEELRDMIESGGGTYTGAMEATRTTHLVAEAPCGAKYEAASSPEWNQSISIVHSRWLEQCHRRMLLLPEEDFPVRPGNELTNSEHEDDQNRRWELPEGNDGDDDDDGDDDFQTTPSKRARTSEVTINSAGGVAAGTAAAAAAAAVAHGGKGEQTDNPGAHANHEPTTNTTSAAVAAVPVESQQQQQAQLEPLPSNSHATATADAASNQALYPWAAGSGGRAGEGEDGDEDEAAGSAVAAARVPSVEEVMALPDGDYLSGCRVIMLGFAAEDLRPLSLLVRKGCGIRYTFPNEEITHVIFGDRDLARAEMVSALEAHPCTPPIVTASWLVETCRAGRVLPTAGYLHALQGRTRTSGSGTVSSSDNNNNNRRPPGGGGGGGRRFGVLANKSRLGAAAGSGLLGGPADTADRQGGGGGTSAGDPPTKDKKSAARDSSGAGKVLQRVGERDGSIARSEVLAPTRQGHENMRQRPAVCEGHGSVSGGTGGEDYLRKSSGDGGGGDNDDNDRSQPRDSLLFGGMLFVVHGTGLSDEEETYASDLIERHGGRCLCPGDTRSVSALRAALVDAGLEMRPDDPSQNSSPAANRAENGQQRALNENNDRDDDNDVGGDGSSCVRAATCSEMSGKPSKPIAGRADGTHLWNVPQHVPTSASSRARRPRHHQQQQRPRHLLQRCFVVSAHGKWTVPPPPPLPPPPLPQRALLSSPCSESERKKGGANERNNNTDEDSNGQHNQIVGGDDDVDEGADGGVTNPRSYRRRRPCPLRSAAHDELWKLLKIQARAKVVSLLWLEACRRVAEVRPPESCECVFRPGPWPIRRFDEEHKRHDFKVAVTGFAGGERTGWEELITVGMGAVLSKSLKKRFTTHLVCKEAKGVKYERALQWGVRVVTPEWLLACAQHGYVRGMEASYSPAAAAAAVATARPTPAFTEDGRDAAQEEYVKRDLLSRGGDRSESPPAAAVTPAHELVYSRSAPSQAPPLEPAHVPDRTFSAVAAVSGNAPQDDQRAQLPAGVEEGKSGLERQLQSIINGAAAAGSSRLPLPPAHMRRPRLFPPHRRGPRSSQASNRPFPPKSVSMSGTDVEDGRRRVCVPMESSSTTSPALQGAEAASDGYIATDAISGSTASAPPASVTPSLTSLSADAASAFNENSSAAIVATDLTFQDAGSRGGPVLGFSASITRTPSPTPHDEDNGHGNKNVDWPLPIGRRSPPPRPPRPPPQEALSPRGNIPARLTTPVCSSGTSAGKDCRDSPHRDGQSDRGLSPLFEGQENKAQRYQQEQGQQQHLRRKRNLFDSREDSLDKQSRSSTTFPRDHQPHDDEQYPHEERLRRRYARGDNGHESSDSVTASDDDNRRNRECVGAPVGAGAEGAPSLGSSSRDEGISRRSGGGRNYIGTSAASDRGGVQRLRRHHAHHRGRHATGGGGSRQEGQEEDGIARDADEEEEQPLMGMEESQIVTYGAQYNPVTGWV